MEIKDITKSLDLYEQSKKKNFGYALNKLVNDIDPSKNIDNYGNMVQKNKNNVVLYNSTIKNENKSKYVQSLLKTMENIPESNGSKLYKRLNYKIGIISDKSVFNLYKNTAHVTYISKNDINKKLDYDFVIISSLNEGMDKTWKNLNIHNSEAQNDLLKFIYRAKDENIPVVFIMDEEYENLNSFSNIAKDCDIIYTNKNDDLENSIEQLENKTVKFLGNQIDPLVHNPIGIDNSVASNNQNKILYADIWDADHPQKQAETKRILDYILKSNYELEIYDKKSEEQDRRYQFPKDYLEFVYENIENEKLSKLYFWSLNINPEKYTDSILSKSIFKSMAMGNIVLSNYNTGINNMIPNVRIINDSEDIGQILNSDKKHLMDLRAKNIRYVMNYHNIYESIKQIVEDIGLNVPKTKDSILVILNDETQSNLLNFERQIYENKTYIVKDQLTPKLIKEYDFVTHFSDEIIYEEYYLADMFTAFKYTDCDFVVKDNFLGKHEYTEIIRDAYTTMFDSNSYFSFEKGDSSGVGYNLDSAEIIYDRSNETKVENVTSKKKLSVIVPIHNNGKYLEEKCFASLERSSSFEDMEIIFVDDGSDDPLTIKTIERILRRHPDIVYYAYDEGSGSASRPRNKGIELANTDLITYLDPDNEATGDGYHYLLNSILENNVDLVVGNIITEHSDKRDAGRYTAAVKNANQNKLKITNPRQLLIDSGMRVQSIQALIVRKSVIQRNKIEMIEGAAGQDTMFFQELILNSESALAIDKYIHVYYAAVTGSVTNTISKKFFDKYYILELKRIPFLEKYNILNVYLENIFNYYLRNWYFKKLDSVAKEEKQDAIERLLQILSLYDKYNVALDNDNREKIDSLIVEKMENYKFQKNTKEKLSLSSTIFNEYIERSYKRKIQYENINDFINKTENDMAKDTLIELKINDIDEMIRLKEVKFNLYNDYNFKVTIPKETIPNFIIEFLKINFYVKSVKSDNEQTNIELFKMRSINKSIENNNENILKRHNTNFKTNSQSHLYTTKEAINLSEQLLNEINRNLINKKKLQSIVDKL